MTVVNTREGYTFVGETTLVSLNCPTCGICYAIPLRMRDKAYELGHGEITWSCPLGHKRIGFHDLSEVERERRKYERERNRANAEHETRVETERRLSAQKGATTRARKRHAAGVCARAVSAVSSKCASIWRGCTPTTTRDDHDGASAQGLDA